MNLAPALLLALLVLVGCTGSGSADPTTATSGTGPTTSTSTTTTTASTTSTSTTSTSTASTTSSGSSAASTVHTDGGDIAVRARDGALEVVEVTAADGWTADHRLEDATHLVVSFERKGGRVEVRVELTPSGIRTVTRSTASG
jgi:hypothetical protein